MQLFARSKVSTFPHTETLAKVDLAGRVTPQELLSNVLCGEAPPRGPTPFFGRKGTAFVHLSMTNSVQKADNAMHRINRYPLESAMVSLTHIRGIVIHPVDSAIYLLSNWGLKPKKGGASPYRAS